MAFPARATKAVQPANLRQHLQSRVATDRKPAVGMELRPSRTDSESCLTFHLSNEGMATPLEQLKSDTSTFRRFSIYRSRREKGGRERAEKKKGKSQKDRRERRCVPPSSSSRPEAKATRPRSPAGKVKKTSKEATEDGGTRWHLISFRVRMANGRGVETLF